MSERIIIARNPGQGSQKQRMGAEVAGSCAAALDTFDEATDILRRDVRELNGAPIDIKYLCFEASDEELGENHATQLAIFATTVAAQRRLRAERPDIKPEIWAGHSVGEYAALVDAGVLGFDEALLLVDARARYMSEAGALAEWQGKPGGIGVVIGDPAEVEAAAAEAGAFIANYNNLKQTGVSGAHTDLAKVKYRFGSRYIEIPVSVAVHSPYMKLAEHNLIRYIGDGAIFSDPADKSVILNRTGEFAANGLDVAVNAPLQVTHAVRWLPGMETALKNIARTEETEASPEVILLEVGAGTVLSGIDKHFAKRYKNVSAASFQTAIETGLDPEALAA